MFTFDSVITYNIFTVASTKMRPQNSESSLTKIPISKRVLFKALETTKHFPFFFKPTIDLETLSHVLNRLKLS